MKPYEYVNSTSVYLNYVVSEHIVHITNSQLRGVTPNVQLIYLLAVTEISKLQVVIITRVEHKEDEKVCIEYLPHTTI